MAVTLKVKGGTEAAINAEVLAGRELAVDTDNNLLYLGTDTGNILIGGAGCWDNEAGTVSVGSLAAGDHLVWDGDTWLNESDASLVDNGDSGGAVEIDWSSSAVQKVTLTANAAITFSAPVGQARLTLLMYQDGTGSRDPSWPASVLWPANTEPTWTAAGGDADRVDFVYDGTNYWGSAELGYNP